MSDENGYTQWSESIEAAMVKAKEKEKQGWSRLKRICVGAQTEEWVGKLKSSGFVTEKINVVGDTYMILFKKPEIENEPKPHEESEPKPCEPALEDGDSLDRLKKLKELLDMGALSKEEYEETKKKLLEKI
jgi:hypothetical protein